MEGIAMQVRVNRLYKYNPTLGDAFLEKVLKKGHIVQVISPNYVGLCSKKTVNAGHVYVRDVYGKYQTMIFKNSLEPIGEHGQFTHYDGSIYHYEKNGSRAWEAWKDGEDHTIFTGHSFANLFEEV